MIIIPTRVCNTNKCSYCWILKKDFEHNFFNNYQNYDFEEKIKLCCEKNQDYEIRFFWWEPFIKIDIIKQIIIKLNNNKYRFVINTNLSLLNEEDILFLKKFNVKIITSCNWYLSSHIITRNSNKKNTILLYKNIKKIIQEWLICQINIVTTPKSVNKLSENIFFINKILWWKLINLLPVNYTWWDNEAILEFKKQLNIIEKDIKSKKLNIDLINKKINNNIALFNSELVIDSDWKLYPSMVILEKFFDKYKNKILISDFTKDIITFKNELNNYNLTDNEIYELYINKIINNSFSKILENDKQISKIFSDFLMQI